MPTFAHKPGPRSLTTRRAASVQAVAIAFAAYAGETVKRIQREELQLVRDFFAADTTIEQRVALVRALDTLRDRRRITLGITLPNGPQRRALQLPPDGPVDVEMLPEDTNEGYKGDSGPSQHVDCKPLETS